HPAGCRTRRWGWPGSASATIDVPPPTATSAACQSADLAAAAGRPTSVQYRPSVEVHSRCAVGPPPTAVSMAEWRPVGTAFSPRTMPSAASGCERAPMAKLLDGSLQLAPFGEIQEV